MTVEQAGLAEKIDAAVDSYIELLNSGTAEQIADLYAADATVEDPIGADIRDTREQLVEFYSVITGMDERTATLKWKKIAGDTAVFEFTLVTKTAGLDEPTGYSHGCTAADYDGDGWIDLLVCCYGGCRLYRNTGPSPARPWKSAMVS